MVIMGQEFAPAEELASPLDDLTAKQREVLDLLIQHKTSKEISRLLGISPHTVDQRIMLARAKLNVATRNEVAQEYRRLLSTYGQSIYDDSHVAALPRNDHTGRREDAEPAPVALRPAGHAPAALAEQPYYHVLPEMFDGPYGTLLRLGYIAGITVFLIMIVLGGLSMFAQLSAMVDT